MKRKAADSTTVVHGGEERPALRPTAVHFVRHGEVHNPRRVFYGRQAGFHLSSSGFVEATALGPQLVQTVAAAAATLLPAVAVAALSNACPPVVLHSPLLRARETAEVAVAACAEQLLCGAAVVLREEPRLLEVHLPYEGWAMSDLVDKVGFDKVYDHGQEGYENWAQVFARVRELVASLVADEQTAGRHIICVCHGDLCLAARLWARRGAAAVSQGRFKRDDVPYPGHCSLTTLLIPRGREWAGAVSWLQEAEADAAVVAAKAAATDARARQEAEAEGRRQRWRVRRLLDQPAGPAI
jgi:broad specificity phosphatase PhoE